MPSDWPDPADYMGAIQHPRKRFLDEELRHSVPVLNRQGLPQIETGQFACAFKLRNDTRTLAVRCFLSPRHGRQQRYALLCEYLQRVSLSALVDFEYLEQGIQCGNRWLPIVKMDWIDGRVLDTFVDQHKSEPQLLRQVATKWRVIVESLRDAGIAHGDLQHGNVLIDCQGEIRLVDYDNMCIPAFRGTESPELGHRNYQHPLRSPRHYDGYIDNFPALVIYVSLLGVAAETDLWDDFYTGENLILAAKDFEQPSRSGCLARLKNSPDPWVSRHARYVERFCLQSVEDVPALHNCIKGTLPPAPKGIIRITTPRSGSAWTWGDELPVAWAFANIGGDVKIELLKGGQHYATIDDNVPIGNAGLGEYAWLINPMIVDVSFRGADLSIGATPLPTGDDYRLRVVVKDGATSVTCESGIFRITERQRPILKLISPAQGEVWKPEIYQAIRWKQIGVESNLKIELLKRGKPILTISHSTSPGTKGDGSCTWRPPTGCDGGNRYTLRVTSTTNPYAWMVTSQYFTILSDRLRSRLEFFAKVWDCSRCYRFFEPSGLWVCPHSIKTLSPVCKWGQKPILSEDVRRERLSDDHFWHRISEVVSRIL